MAEFKFSCPQCDQHILCDTGYAGVQINCPTCKQAIIVPQPPRSAAAPPVPPSMPSTLSTQRSTSSPVVPAAGMRAAAALPVQKKSSSAVKTILTVSCVVIALAALGVGGWFGYKKFAGGGASKKANPAAQVSAPSADAAIHALSVLTKVHAAYTNTTSAKADGTFTAFLNLSNILTGDINPSAPDNMKNRRPPGMPRIVTNTTSVTVKREQTNFYYLAAESVSKIDRQTFSNTFAYWKSDKGQFSFMDMHQPRIPPMYRQLPETDAAQAPTEQVKKIQEMFADPANLTKLVKDLGQTDDEPVNGQDCYTLTAKVLGQKVKIWVDKSTYLIPQWQITLGGQISDADIDDAFSLWADAVTNTPPAQLDMIKAQFKKFAPVMMKIRGTLAFTAENIEVNPTLTADDFNYPVPAGVRLVQMPSPANARATSLETRQRNTCINNLRQIDAAKNQWALEKSKTTGTAVTEADITPYLAGGRMPACPAGGKYTLGNVGEKPTCSIPGHELP
ncbi:MAG TPA: hypothetical protein VK810_00755 [Dongiaceae bacterium]|jgi:hypothetical protein|nr:hypothetical protein [Dongiaceae bacterium]